MRGFSTSSPCARPWVVALCLALLLPAGVQAAVDEPELKAAIVFNLLLFVEWPPEREPTATQSLVLCLRSGSELFAPLERLSQRPIRNARLDLRALLPEGDVRPCHALFSDGPDGDRSALARRIGRSTGAIVIADETAQPSDGTSIQLRRLDSRIGFDVSLVALRQAGVQVSSKLLRLAKAIRE